MVQTSPYSVTHRSNVVFCPWNGCCFHPIKVLPYSAFRTSAMFCKISVMLCPWKFCCVLPMASVLRSRRDRWEVVSRGSALGRKLFSKHWGCDYSPNIWAVTVLQTFGLKLFSKHLGCNCSPNSDALQFDRIQCAEP